MRKAECRIENPRSASHGHPYLFLLATATAAFRFDQFTCPGDTLRCALPYQVALIGMRPKQSMLHATLALLGDFFQTVIEEDNLLGQSLS
jgi:hypothetical protein